jgi:pilus assembly protein CpaB
MKARGMTVVLAFLLAVGATGAVYLYLKGANEVKKPAANMVSVIVSKRDISANTGLDNLIKSGAFTTTEIPADAVVSGAVTQLEQLQGRTTRYPIVAGEQITTARFLGSTNQPAGGVLGIPSGYKAVTVSVESSRAVGGVLQVGDHVTLYATFKDVKLITGTLRKILAGKGSQKKIDIGDLTATVVPDVQVLKVGTPDSSGVGSSSNETIQLTLALTARDAQRVVLAEEEGSVWLALLPPGEEGTPEAPINMGEVAVR